MGKGQDESKDGKNCQRGQKERSIGEERRRKAQSEGQEEGSVGEDRRKAQ